MKNLIITHWQIFAALVLGVAFIAWRQLSLRHAQKERLIAAGLLTEKSKIYRRRSHIFITDTNPAKNSAELSARLTTFEEVLEQRISEIRLVLRPIWQKIFLFRKNGLMLYKDRTPAKVAFKDIPKINSSEIYLGQSTPGPLIIDIQKTHCGYISGRPGSGKTMLFRTIASSFLRNNDKADVIILDAKNSFSSLKGHPQIYSYDARQRDGLVAAAQHFQEIAAAAIKSEKILEAQGLRPEVMREVREKQPDLLPLRQTLILCDEAFFYTSLRKGDPLVKEKTLIVDYLEDFVRRGRSFGIHLIFGIQDGHASQFFLPREYFNLRIFSRTSAELSRSLVGSDALTNERLNESGMFYAHILLGERGGSFAGYFRSPWMPSSGGEL